MSYFKSFCIPITSFVQSSICISNDNNPALSNSSHAHSIQTGTTRQANTYYAKVTTLPGPEMLSNSCPKPPIRKQSILSEADLRRQSLISAFMSQKTTSQTQISCNKSNKHPPFTVPQNHQNQPKLEKVDFTVRQSISNVKIEEPDYDCVADITAGIAAKAALKRKMRRKTLTEDSQQELKQILDMHKPVVGMPEIVKPEPLPVFREDEDPADTLSSSEHLTYF